MWKSLQIVSILLVMPADPWHILGSGKELRCARVDRQVFLPSSLTYAAPQINVSLSWLVDLVCWQGSIACCHSPYTVGWGEWKGEMAWTASTSSVMMSDRTLEASHAGTELNIRCWPVLSTSYNSLPSSAILLPINPQVLVD